MQQVSTVCETGRHWQVIFNIQMATVKSVIPNKPEYLYYKEVKVTKYKNINKENPTQDLIYIVKEPTEVQQNPIKHISIKTHSVLCLMHIFLDAMTILQTVESSLGLSF